MFGMQNQLRAHITLSVEKSGQLDRAVKLEPGNGKSQWSQCNRKNIQYYLPHYPGFFLPRCMIDRKFNHSHSGRGVAQNAQFGNFSTNDGAVTFQLQFFYAEAPDSSGRSSDSDSSAPASAAPVPAELALSLSS